MLQHRFGEDAQQAEEIRTVKLQDLTPRDQAERAVYRRSDDTFYFPGAAISRLLREAGGAHKQRGSRKSVKYLVPAAVIVLDEDITILDPNTDEPIKDYEVDGRPVTIPATKGRVMRYRPRFDKWAAVFELSVDTEVLDPETIQKLLTEGGRRIGIGDYRPEKGGPFGRFMVTRWDELKENGNSE